MLAPYSQRGENVTLDSPVVMIVDDEAPVRTSIAAMLDLEGYAVVEARTGDEAIEIMRRQGVDAVISDIRMPGPVDGLGLADWMANNAPAVALLLMSGKRRPAALKQLPPATQFLQKPFRMQDLLSALGRRVRIH